MIYAFHGLETCAWFKGWLGEGYLRHLPSLPAALTHGKAFFSRIWGSGLEICEERGGSRVDTPRGAHRKGPPSLQRWGGALRREREGGALRHSGRTRGGAPWALKVGARSFFSASATSTSRCIFTGAAAAFLCGSRTSPHGVVLQAHPSCRFAASAAAAAGRPARTVGCADTSSDPVSLRAPRCAP